MTVTVELSNRHAEFLKWMVDHDKKFENVKTMEDAVRECIDMAMFDENETLASQEGM